MTIRRKFTVDYRRQTARAWQDSELTVREFAAANQLDQSVLREWVSIFGDREKRAAGRTGFKDDRLQDRGMGSRSHSPQVIAKALKAVVMAMEQESLTQYAAIQEVAAAMQLKTTKLHYWVKRAVAKRTMPTSSRPPAPSKPAPVPEAPSLVANGHLVAISPANPFETTPADRVVIQGHIVSGVPEPVVLYVRYMEAELNRLQREREVGIEFATMLGKDRERR